MSWRRRVQDLELANQYPDAAAIAEGLQALAWSCLAWESARHTGIRPLAVGCELTCTSGYARAQRESTERELRDLVDYAARRGLLPTPPKAPPPSEGEPDAELIDAYVGLRRAARVLLASVTQFEGGQVQREAWDRLSVAEQRLQKLDGPRQ